MAIIAYLLDTNAGIDYLSENMPENGLLFLDDIVDNGYTISIITRIELYAHHNLTPPEKESLDILVNQASVLSISHQIADKTIEIRKSCKTKLPDAIIAATAIENNLTLVSRNIKDFKNFRLESSQSA